MSDKPDAELTCYGGCSLCGEPHRTLIEHIAQAEARAAQAERRLQIAIEVVNEQAEDGGIWFFAETAAEAYLQCELRRLHAAVAPASPQAKEE